MSTPSRRDYTAPDATIPQRLRNFLSLEDFDRAAQQHLPRPLYGYVAGGHGVAYSIHLIYNFLDVTQSNPTPPFHRFANNGLIVPAFYGFPTW